MEGRTTVDHLLILKELINTSKENKQPRIDWHLLLPWINRNKINFNEINSEQMDSQLIMALRTPTRPIPLSRKRPYSSIKGCCIPSCY